MRVSFEKCISIVFDAKNIALFCHTRPDGDSLGAALAFKKALTKAGKKAVIFCDDFIPQKFESFGFKGHFLKEFNNDKFDLMIAIDCGDINRLGAFSALFSAHQNTLTIDHHMGHDDFGVFTYLEGLSSTCEIILNMCLKKGIDLDDEIATALFIGLSTDTGNFKHSNTNKKTFAAAQILAEYNIDIAQINRKFYNENSINRLKLLGLALSNMRSYFDGKLYVIFVTQNDFNKAKATMEDTEGFTDYAVDVDTAEIGVCISQNNQNSFKVSMRSKGKNVAEICRHFGGGGHIQAAGCVMCGFLEDVIDKIVRTIGDFVWTDSLTS